MRLTRSNASLFRAYDRSQAFLMTRAMPRTDEADNLVLLSAEAHAAVAPAPLTVTIGERTEGRIQ